MNLSSQIESLLFVAAKPLTTKQLAELTSSDKKEVEKTLDDLVKNYTGVAGGLSIIRIQDKFQMVSSPSNATVVQKFIAEETSSELSRPSLETLTIIAYRGPITKLDLDRIRGINCSLILKNLQLRGLVESFFDKKKKETYYQVTMDFVRFLGITSLNQLPDYEKLSKEETIDKMIAENQGG